MAEYISRVAVLEHLNKCKEDPLFDPDMARICFAISIFIENMAAADVQPVRRGEWQQDGATHKRCSNCKQFLVPNLKSSMFAYCPNCGARMKQED